MSHLRTVMVVPSTLLRTIVIKALGIMEEVMEIAAGVTAIGVIEVEEVIEEIVAAIKRLGTMHTPRIISLTLTLKTPTMKHNLHLITHHKINIRPQTPIPTHSNTQAIRPCKAHRRITATITRHHRIINRISKTKIRIRRVQSRTYHLAPS